MIPRLASLPPRRRRRLYQSVTDGLSGEEGTQYLHVWLVEALTRAGRLDRSRLEEARLIFERRSTPGIAATPWESSRKLSRTSPWSAPRSTWTARWGPADHETQVVERRCRPRNAVSRLIRAGAPSA